MVCQLVALNRTAIEASIVGLAHLFQRWRQLRLCWGRSELSVMGDRHVLRYRSDVQMVYCIFCIIELQGHGRAPQRFDFTSLLQLSYDVDPLLVKLG